MNIPEEIRLIATEVKTNPEMDNELLEMLAMRGDNVSKYAIKKIVELEFSLDHVKEELARFKSINADNSETSKIIRFLKEYFGVDDDQMLVDEIGTSVKLDHVIRILQQYKRLK